MTEEEIAEEYANENWEHYEEGQNDAKALKQAVLYGIKKGRELESEENCDLATIAYLQGASAKEKALKKRLAETDCHFHKRNDNNQPKDCHYSDKEESLNDKIHCKTS